MQASANVSCSSPYLGGICHATKLQICLDADPSEAIRFHSEDLRLFQESGVDVVVAHLGQQISLELLESLKSTRGCLIDAIVWRR